MKNFTNRYDIIPYLGNKEFTAPEGFEFSVQSGVRELVPEFRAPEHMEYFLESGDGKSVVQQTAGAIKGLRLILKKIEPPRTATEALKSFVGSSSRAGMKPTEAFRHIGTRLKFYKGEFYKDGNSGFIRLGDDFQFSNMRDVYERIEL